MNNFSASSNALSKTGLFFFFFNFKYMAGKSTGLQIQFGAPALIPTQVPSFYPLFALALQVQISTP